MRILFMVSRDETNPRAAGGDVQAAAYARYLSEAGHQVTFWTSTYEGAPRKEARKGVEVERLGGLSALPLRCWLRYRRSGDEFDLVYTEAIGGTRFPFLAPLYVRQPLLAAWYQVNRPVFIHQYGRVAGGALGALERGVARLHGGATVLTPSESRRGDLIAMGFRPERVFAVPPLALRTMPAHDPDLASGEPLIVWLGKVRRYKCVHLAIEAMAEVVKRCPAARLVVAGRRDDPAYLRELQVLVARLGLANSVGFAFDLSEKEKADLLAKATALVLPSPIEGFGIVILEAAALGTPAVVSEGVPEEAVTDGYNGLRVPFGDTGALAGAIVRVLQSTDLHEELARNALAWARGFSKEMVLAKLGAAITAAMSPHPATVPAPERA
jgi:glycosyltransferase involved in cell wall biosynthesis